MNRYRWIGCLGLLCLSVTVGQESRALKALSAEEIEGYLNGSGMGLAQAAELNHYPGPRHVLELADDLQLTDAQRADTQALFERMQASATALGRRLIEKEEELDGLFADQQATAEDISELLQDIGKLQAELRFVHLNAHLEQRSILTPHQVKLYDKARGYTDGTRHDAHH